VLDRNRILPIISVQKIEKNAILTKKIQDGHPKTRKFWKKNEIYTS
jgi:hypothetical protein